MAPVKKKIYDLVTNCRRYFTNKKDMFNTVARTEVNRKFNLLLIPKIYKENKQH